MQVNLNLTKYGLHTCTNVGGSLVHKVMTYMTLGGVITFSGLTLVVRLMCLIFFERIS